MAITRVIATLPYYTNIPEDQATNTFYFASVAEPDLAACNAIALRLDAFYAAIDAYLSPVISPGLGTFTFYKMSDPAPRTPFADLPMQALALGTSGAPEEVAICVSYSAVQVSGEPASRRRGRIFIGPLANTALSSASSSAFSFPSSAAVTAIRNAAIVLADQSESFQWAVYSPTDQIARQIVNGWLDNSLDTQRRRGRRPTVRNAWTGQP